MTSYFQDGGHDIRPPLTAAYVAANACDVIGWPCALQFLIHSIRLVLISQLCARNQSLYM